MCSWQQQQVQIGGNYTSVCVSSLSADGTCYDTPAGYEAAKEMCEAQGARLCSSAELLAADENTLCGHDERFVWTATSCGNPFNHLAVNRSRGTTSCFSPWIVTPKPSLRCCGDDKDLSKGGGGVDEPEDNNNDGNAGASGGGGGFGSANTATLSIILSLVALVLAAVLVLHVIATRRRRRESVAPKYMYDSSKTGTGPVFHDADYLEVPHTFLHPF